MRCVKQTKTVSVFGRKPDRYGLFHGRSVCGIFHRSAAAAILRTKQKGFAVRTLRNRGIHFMRPYGNLVKGAVIFVFNVVRALLNRAGDTTVGLFVFHNPSSSMKKHENCGRPPKRSPKSAARKASAVIMFRKIAIYAAQKAEILNPRQAATARRTVRWKAALPPPARSRPRPP